MNVMLGGVGALAISAVAMAVPTNFDIRSITISETGFIEDYTLAGYRWGNVDTFGGATFFIGVSSGPSMRPGWQYEITFDYTNYDIGFFGPAGTHALDLTGIKDPGTPDFITDVFVKDLNGNAVGNWSTDGFNIFFDASVGEILAAGEVITIQFNQIPTPGAAALFGVGGLAMTRRRR